MEPDSCFDELKQNELDLDRIKRYMKYEFTLEDYQRLRFLHLESNRIIKEILALPEKKLLPTYHQIEAVFNTRQVIQRRIEVATKKPQHLQHYNLLIGFNKLDKEAAGIIKGYALKATQEAVDNSPNRYLFSNNFSNKYTYKHRTKQRELTKNQELRTYRVDKYFEKLDLSESPIPYKVVKATKRGKNGNKV